MPILTGELQALEWKPTLNITLGIAQTFDWIFVVQDKFITPERRTAFSRLPTIGWFSGRTK
jgi:hypothetical protein